jgi:hypothetical protein
MTRERAGELVGLIKAAGGYLSPDAEAAWIREFTRDCYLAVSAEAVVNAIIDSGKKIDLMVFRKTYNQQATKAHVEKIEEIECWNYSCDKCNGIGYMGVVLCGPNPGGKPCYQERMTGNSIQEFYWVHRVPCIYCEKGRMIARKHHVSFSQDRQKWEAVMQYALAWNRACYYAEDMQIYSAHALHGAKLPDRFLPGHRPTKEERELTEGLKKIMAKSVEILAAKDKPARKEDLVVSVYQEGTL